ncbi:MAG: galactose oxidase [Armatimonadetes bacterium]|nr:galactose oxidase [Armatimonadota bacterium]
MGRIKAATWVRVTEHAEWQPRDSCGEVVFDGRMWLMGGWFTSFGLGPRDVWCSEDGAKWTLVTPEAEWRHGDLPTSLVHGGRMWMMGGWYGGRLPSSSGSNQVWYSQDGAHWQCATACAGWSPRTGAGGVVHDGRMWILGGVESFFAEEASHLRNDVWYSADGAHWTLATANAPWPPRACHAAVVFNGRIWVFGGWSYLSPDHSCYNDVWSSADGVHWDRMSEHAPWPPRFWFSAATYRNRIWVLGGFSKDPHRNWGDVWYTEDGAHWTELKADAVWKPRHEHSAFVFQDKLWVAGGHAQPLANDVWRLDIEE